MRMHEFRMRDDDQMTIIIAVDLYKARTSSQFQTKQTVKRMPKIQTVKRTPTNGDDPAHQSSRIATRAIAHEGERERAMYIRDIQVTCHALATVGCGKAPWMPMKKLPHELSEFGSSGKLVATVEHGPIGLRRVLLTHDRPVVSTIITFAYF